MGDSILWEGSIYGKYKDRERLWALGVGAMMVYRPRLSCFDYCHCNTATMERLIKEWPGFDPSEFTGMNEDEELFKWSDFTGGQDETGNTGLREALQRRCDFRRVSSLPR